MSRAVALAVLAAAAVWGLSPTVDGSFYQPPGRRAVCPPGWQAHPLSCADYPAPGAPALYGYVLDGRRVCVTEQEYRAGHTGRVLGGLPEIPCT